MNYDYKIVQVATVLSHKNTTERILSKIWNEIQGGWEHYAATEVLSGEIITTQLHFRKSDQFTAEYNYGIREVLSQHPLNHDEKISGMTHEIMRLNPKSTIYGSTEIISHFTDHGAFLTTRLYFKSKKTQV